MEIIHESDAEEIKFPGRYMRWLISPKKSKTENFSVCIIRVPANQTVHPAHSHPHGEEVIYIIKGKGRVMVNDEVNEVKEGMAVFFPPGSVHMLQNTEKKELKVICFFSPPSDVTKYRYFKEVSFPKK